MKKISLKEILKNKIPRELINLIPTSFDIIGSKHAAIAILQLDSRLSRYKYEIAIALQKIHKNVKTVVNKLSERKGEFRLYDYEILIGNITEVLHKEYGYYIKIDPLKVYFSPRDAEDRVDIAKQVKRNEKIIYMFAGAGPYAIAIYKFQPNFSQLIAIEKNEIAYKYLVKNVLMNKAGNKIKCILSDVREACLSFLNFADRIIMTLPLGGHEFLDLSLKCLKDKSGGIIHFYHLGDENNLFSEAINLINKYCNDLNYEYKILKTKKVNEYSPRKFKVRIDFFAKKI